MSETETEFLISGPFRIEKPGYDGEAYAWYVGPKRVEIRFTDSAVQSGDMSARAERAHKTLGRSEAVDFLAWHTPPDWVEFSTDNLPWIEGGEVSG